jgi:hypothetical protein
MGRARESVYECGFHREYVETLPELYMIGGRSRKQSCEPSVYYFGGGFGSGERR